MNTIETEVWEPCPEKPGCLQFVRTKTVEKWAAEVKAEFKLLTPENKWGTGDFEWFGLAGLEYGPVKGWEKTSSLPRNARLAVYCEQGANEGYIVNVALLPDETPAVVLLCGKCFDRDYSYKATRQLSEILGIMPRPQDPLVYARCIILPPTPQPKELATA